MSDDPQAELDRLERDLRDEPLFIRRRDLPKVNALRERLRLPPVDADLRPATRVESIPAAPAAAAPAPTTDEHARARALRARWLEREAKLAPHRTWAQATLRAVTHQPDKGGDGRTPVEPLAVGSRGGPIVCEVCKKPFPLEGGRVNGMPADAAWKRHGSRGMRSFISGGLVFELQPNGTLHFFHGYQEGGARGAGCYARGRAAEAAARKAWVRQDEPGAHAALVALATAELGMKLDEARRWVQEVMAALFGFDPGTGVNGP